jgi:hypothetical protein
MRLIAVAGLAVALSGCIVAVRGPGGPHPSAGHVQYSAWDETEVHYVIFRDFFGCSDRDVWRLTAIRRLYSLDAADLFFLMFVSRHVSVSFDVVFRAWWDTCRRDHHRLVVLYRLSPTIFFVPVPAHVQCPPPYGRAYGYWRNRTLGSASLTADEYRSLVAMKVACDYYGHAPVHFFDRVKAVGAPEKVIYADHRHAGRGGKDARGLAVAAQVARPWEMDKGRRDSWKRQAEEASRKEEQEQKGRGGGPPVPPPGREDDRRGPPDDRGKPGDRGKPDDRGKQPDPKGGPPEPGKGKPDDKGGAPTPEEEPDSKGKGKGRDR